MMFDIAFSIPAGTIETVSLEPRTTTGIEFLRRELSVPGEVVRSTGSVSVSHGRAVDVMLAGVLAGVSFETVVSDLAP